MRTSDNIPSQSDSSYQQWEGHLEEVDDLIDRRTRVDRRIDLLTGQLRGVREDLTVAREERTVVRRELDAYLSRHFYSSAELRRLLGVSGRLIQALAAQESATFRCASGELIVLGLRSIRHGGRWFPRADIDRLVGTSSRASRS